MPNQPQKSQSQDFLLRHPEEGLFRKFDAHKNYDFIGKLRDLGMLEIDNGDSKSGWPWSWAGTRLTEAGRAARNPAPQPREEGQS